MRHHLFQRLEYLCQASGPPSFLSLKYLGNQSNDLNVA